MSAAFDVQADTRRMLAEFEAVTAKDAAALAEAERDVKSRRKDLAHRTRIAARLRKSLDEWEQLQADKNQTP